MIHQDRAQHPDFERQMDLEEEMFSRGASGFEKKMAEARATGLESTTNHGSSLVKNVIGPVSRAIEKEAWLRVEAERKHGGKRERKAQVRDSEA